MNFGDSISAANRRAVERSGLIKEMFMKKIAAFIAFGTAQHKVFATTVALSAGAGAGVLAAAAGLDPFVWAAATLGAAYVYLHHDDKPRNRLFNIVLSIILGAFGSNASAAWVKASYKLDSPLIEVFLALVIAMAWPWVFERFLGKKE